MELDINWQDFHFLRPQAMWLIAVVVGTGLLLLVAESRQAQWQQIIPEHLRAFVIAKGSSWLNRGIIITFTVIGSLLCLALAGPTWEKVEVPGQVRQSILLIGLDMSRSMNADDISPSRLEHAKLKIQDLLNLNPGTRTGLIGFAGTPHMIIPPTEDYNLVNFQSEYLVTSMMPSAGSNIERLITYADTLLNVQPVPGTLLLITDEITSAQSAFIINYLRNSPHSIEVWVIASRDGGFARDSRNRILTTDNGDQVLSQPDAAVLSNLDQQERVTVQWITLDTSDAEQISSRISERLNVQESDEVKEDTWEDRGLLLVWPAAFFVLLWFRRGWVVQLCLVFVLMGCDPTSDHGNWWYSADYRAQAFYENGDYEQAAALYTNPESQGIAYFKAGDYEAAAALFAEDSTDAGRYRLSMALYQLGDYEAAAEALQTMDSTNQTAQSKELMAQIQQNLSEVDSVKRFSEESSDKPKLNNEDPLNLRKAKGKDEELTSDTEVDELPTGGNRVADEVATDIRKARELDEPPGDQQEGAEIDPSKILLQQSKADPTDFLRKRFRLQYRRYYQGTEKAEKPW